MIAKIGKGANLYGAVSYNQQKVEREKGTVLLAHKLPDTPDGNYTTAQICRYFEPYLTSNIKTEKPVRHISLNPDPSDKVSDERFREMAEQYMKEMGYGNQPYIVYKHTDIERTHIHIVTTCVAINGKKISDSYDHPRSMAACRKLEQQFNLKPVTEKVTQETKPGFKPVDYSNGDIKSQLASVIRYLPKYYKFPNMGTYNALLSLFNIACEQVEGEAFGMPKRGLVYFALDAQGNKAGKPFKSSLFGGTAGLEHLESHFERSRQDLNVNPSKSVIKNTVEAALHMATGETDFKQQLLEQGINTVVRRNEQGRVYGITFIDHTSRSVWNGSHLGKTFSANVFNDWWNNGMKMTLGDAPATAAVNVSSIPENKVSDPFNFLDKEKFNMTQDNTAGVILGSLIPDVQAEDYEELAFENRMKKRKKKFRK